RTPHSFPTRRSSDLRRQQLRVGEVIPDLRTGAGEVDFEDHGVLGAVDGDGEVGDALVDGRGVHGQSFRGVVLPLCSCVPRGGEDLRRIAPPPGAGGQLSRWPKRGAGSGGATAAGFCASRASASVTPRSSCGSCPATQAFGGSGTSMSGSTP